VETLTLVLDHVLPAGSPPAGRLPSCAGIDYRLVGTGAAMLHGVDLPVGDLDLLFLERAGVGVCRCPDAL
jgi:hypothetical protein